MILRSFHTLIGYCLVLKKVAKDNLKQKKEILHTIKDDGFLLTLGSQSLWSSLWDFSTVFLHRTILKSFQSARYCTALSIKDVSNLKWSKIQKYWLTICKLLLPLGQVCWYQAWSLFNLSPVFTKVYWFCSVYKDPWFWSLVQ